MEILRRAWTESKNEQWKPWPKRRTNLFAHYYDVDVSEQRRDYTKRKVLTCGDNFFEGDVLGFIRTVNCQDWLLIEELKEFELQGLLVRLRIDSCLRRK